ncbi:hypothetical protein V2J09_000050 [Rumex salicifolius]
MGCVSGKPSSSQNTRKEKVAEKRLTDYGKAKAAALKREGSSSAVGDRSETVKPFLIERKPSSSIGYPVDHSQKRRVKPEDVFVHGLPFDGIYKSSEGEQVAAGWPSWLASVAGEALGGWIPRKADSFEKLDKIGQGTYSSVYKAKDLIYSKTVALKRVRFDNLDPESVKFMAREILVLRKLDHPNVIKLEGLIASSSSCSLYLIFEYMEHDLTGLLSLPGVKFTEPQIKCYMKQLLSGLEHCHGRGVLHRDIKGSNLLIDDSGILKIADFGLATFYEPSEIKSMTSRVVTLWYRPPELLLGATCYSGNVDLWSAGCILGELYSNKPLMPGRTEVEQLHKIFKLCGSPSEEFWATSKLRHAAAFRPNQTYRRRIAERFKDIPASALQLIETLLSIDPVCRGSAASALNSEFFTTEPLACDPSSLPKYPPSKEIDVKIREERMRRREAIEGQGTRVGSARHGPEHYEAALADKASADLVTSVQIQERKRESILTNPNRTFNSRQERSSSNMSSGHLRILETTKEASSRETVDQLRQRGMHSGPLTRGIAWSNMGKRPNDPLMVTRTREVKPDPSQYTSPGTQTRMAENHRLGPSLYSDYARGVGRYPPGFSNELNGAGIDDRLYHTHSVILSNEHDNKARVSRPAMDSFKVYTPSDDHDMYFSGPLMLQSKNIEELLRQRDRQIQEAARRTRFEKSNRRKPASNQPLVSRR